MKEKQERTVCVCSHFCNMPYTNVFSSKIFLWHVMMYVLELDIWHHHETSAALLDLFVPGSIMYSCMSVYRSWAQGNPVKSKVPSDVGMA